MGPFSHLAYVRAVMTPGPRREGETLYSPRIAASGGQEPERAALVSRAGSPGREAGGGRPRREAEAIHSPWPPASGGQEPERAALLWGSLAPDAGYYPGAGRELAELAHEGDPVAFGSRLLALAGDEAERAFARGWLSHVWLDRRGHAELVEPLAGDQGSPGGLLAHKRIEWGLDLWVLSQPGGTALAALPRPGRAGLDLWRRGLAEVHGRPASKELLHAALLAEYGSMALVLRVWRLTGLWASRSPVERAGAWLGGRLRPRLAAWYAGRGDLDRLAVLTPRPPEPGELALWGDFLASGPAELARLTGESRPAGARGREGCDG